MKSILELILPEEIFRHFDIIETQTQAKEVHIYLDEKNIIPDLYKDSKLISKGFTPSTTIQDFPLRDKALYLHVRRRKWQEVNTGKIISNKFGLTANGTQYSEGFAAFLKGIIGYLPDKF